MQTENENNEQQTVASEVSVMTDDGATQVVSADNVVDGPTLQEKLDSKSPTDVADDQADPVEPVTVERRTGVCPNVEMTKPVFDKLSKPGPVDIHESVAVIGADHVELAAHAETYRNLDIGRGDPALRWLASVKQGEEHMSRDDAFNSTVRREGAMFRQSIHGEDGEQLAAGRPQFGEPSGGKLVGPQAVMKIKGLLGMGTVARVPLWHSGLWLNFKAPSETDLLELERRIANEKITLGRMTNGGIFSNVSVYLNSFLMNFCLAHVYEATYKQVPALELKKLIRATDLPQMLWGLLCTIYPSGYAYRQPCVNDPTKCLHVVEETLNLNKISWTDDRALTDSQRKHMTQRTAKFTDEQIQKYQDEHRFNERFGSVELHPGLKMILRVPSLEELEQGGFAWVDSVVERADAAFRGDVVGEERNRMITEMGMSTALRQYGQWVHKLVLDDGETIIEDRSTIDDTLSTLTAHGDVYEKFFSGIEQFINNSTITVIGVPKINCPKCDKPMTNDEKRHPHLIALDITNIFFTLLDQRVVKLLGRR